MLTKLILSDADGCLLAWEEMFSSWMQECGYTLTDTASKSYSLHERYNELDQQSTMTAVKQFNESAAIAFLPAFRDSAYYVKRLHEEHGYEFRVITSLGLNQNAQKLREMNLRNIFGNAIESIIYLDTGADKDAALAPYKDTGLYWIEDKFSNYKLGLDLGLKSILMLHPYNIQEYPLHGQIAHNWQRVYEIITTEGSKKY